MNPAHIMILAGEASGDAHGAAMARHLQRLQPGIQLTGMGSGEMRAAGIDLFFDSSNIAVVGLVEVLKHWGDIKQALALVKQKLDQTHPDLLVLIDYQEFNQKIAAYAKQSGIKVLFYISPQVWAWRPKRVHKIGKIIDHMAVIFKFEEDFYRKANIPVTFVGNPLVGKAKISQPASNTRLQLGFEDEDTIIGLFPGSRQSEISRLLPVMLDSARLLANRHPSLKFILPVATTLDRSVIASQCQQSGLPIKLTNENLYDAIVCCDSIVSCSGTATLEIALMKVPLCIIYKTAWLTFKIMRRLVSIDCIGLANIVAGKPIVREFLQHEATAANISAELERMTFDSAYREQMINDLAQIEQNLGQENGSENVAKLALQLLNDND